MIHRYTNKQLNEWKEELIQVEWLDIVTETRQSIRDTEGKSTYELMAKCVSYGVLHSFDDYGIIIASEYSDDEFDYTVIPRELIIDINLGVDK